MIVHIKLLSEFMDNPDPDSEIEYDYSKTKLIATDDIEEYDRFVSLLQKLKENEKPVIIDEDWYNIEDYGLNFPKGSAYMPVLYVYVSECY